MLIIELPIQTSLRRRQLRQDRRIHRGLNRTGAILLDLFIATTILATSLLVLSDYGAKSIKLAQRNSIERLEILTAESILAKAVDLPDYQKSRSWSDSIQGLPIEIQLDVVELEAEKLRKIRVEVSTRSESPANRISVSLSRLVFTGEGL